MTPSELSDRLAAKISSVAPMLLPNGKKVGSEWRAGSLGGEEGKSLGVHLTGSKAGVWSDFATGQGGDVLDLWCAVEGVSIAQACKDVQKYLGIEEPRFVGHTQRSYSRPPRPACKPATAESKGMAYLRGRKLSEAAISAYKVASNGKEIIFPSLRDGELLAIKYLGIDRVDGKKQIRVEANAEPCLFGWQAIPDDARTVVLAEGEGCAASWYTMGIPALSVPFGGGTGGKQRWIDNELPNLDRFDWIYVAMDEDKSGHEATREIVERLGVHRCKVVTFPNGFNDANDMLCSEGVTQAEFQALLDQATTTDPEELRGAETYVDDLIDIFHPSDDVEPGFSPPWDTFDEFRFRPGEVTILGGINGHGKSQLAGNIVLEAMHQGQRASIASMEFRAEKMLGRLTRQATCRPDPSVAYIRQAAQWYQDRLWVFDVVGTAKADRILEVFDYARRRYGIDLFVVDNLAKCGYAEDDYNGQKGLLDRLTDFVKLHHCHLILVVHLRKGMDESQPVGKFSVKGSGAITDMADSLLLIWRNKAKEAARKAELASGGSKPMPQKLVDQSDTTLNCEKQRNGESEPWAALTFDPTSTQFLPNGNVSPKKYVQFQGEST